MGWFQHKPSNLGVDQAASLRLNMEQRGDGMSFGYLGRCPHKKYAGKHIKMPMHLTHSSSL
jgi:nitrite reductase/ring-hydroxylating ferredoxin subunit